MPKVVFSDHESSGSRFSFSASLNTTKRTSTPHYDRTSMSLVSKTSAITPMIRSESIESIDLPSDDLEAPLSPGSASVSVFSVETVQISSPNSVYDFWGNKNTPNRKEDSDPQNPKPPKHIFVPKPSAKSLFQMDSSVLSSLALPLSLTRSNDDEAQSVAMTYSLDELEEAEEGLAGLKFLSA